jgi:hypothetical protein
MKNLLGGLLMISPIALLFLLAYFTRAKLKQSEDISYFEGEYEGLDQDYDPVTVSISQYTGSIVWPEHPDGYKAITMEFSKVVRDDNMITIFCERDAVMEIVLNKDSAIIELETYDSYQQYNVVKQ